MKVKIVFHGVLKKYNDDLPEREEEVPEGAVVRDLISKTRVPEEEIAFAAVNDSRAALSHELREGDAVKLFQFVGGG